MSYLDSPTYSPALAGRLVGLRPERVRRWLEGYHYNYPAGTGRPKIIKRKDPLVRREGARESRFASFLDIIELLFVKRFVDHGISVQKVRNALLEVEEILGSSAHHFAQQHFWTDGSNVYLEVKDKSDKLLQLLSGGQWVIEPVIRHYAKQIDFDRDTGFAEKWFPLGRQEPVVVDPQIAFGAPTVMGRGIETANLYDLFVAESRNLKIVCSWFDVAKSEAQSAIKFEEKLRLAA